MSISKKNDYALFQKMLSKFLGCEVASEVLFCKGRKFRFDFAILDKKIAIEIEGGVWSGGRHTRGAGYSKDMEKYNLATLNGWRLLRYTPDQLNSLQTFEQIKTVFNL